MPPKRKPVDWTDDADRDAENDRLEYEEGLGRGRA